MKKDSYISQSRVWDFIPALKKDSKKLFKNLFQLCLPHLQKSVWMCSENKLVKYPHNTLKLKQVCSDLSSYDWYKKQPAVFYVVRDQTKEEDNSTLRNIQVIILISLLHSSQNSTLRHSSDITRMLCYFTYMFVRMLSECGWKFRCYLAEWWLTLALRVMRPCWMIEGNKKI